MLEIGITVAELKRLNRYVSKTSDSFLQSPDTILRESNLKIQGVAFTALHASATYLSSLPAIFLNEQIYLYGMGAGVGIGFIVSAIKETVSPMNVSVKEDMIQWMDSWAPLNKKAKALYTAVYTATFAINTTFSWLFPAAAAPSNGFAMGLSLGWLGGQCTAQAIRRRIELKIRDDDYKLLSKEYIV